MAYRSCTPPCFNQRMKMLPYKYDGVRRVRYAYAKEHSEVRWSLYAPIIVKKIHG